MEESKSISRAPGYYHWALVIIIIIIILFVYLSIFIAIEFLLTTVNKSLSYFKSFRILLTCRISRPEEFSGRGVFCGCAGDFRGHISA